MLEAGTKNDPSLKERRNTFTAWGHRLDAQLAMWTDLRKESSY